MKNDKELINKILAGDRSLFGVLVNKYKDRVFNIIYSFCGANANSDDISQNVFIKIYGSLGKFNFKSSFSTWVYRIVVNECINWANKRNYNVISLNTNISDDHEVSDLLESSDNIEKHFLTKEVRKFINDALYKLPEKYRIILTLKDIEDFSYDEISEIMDISIDKVKVWLFRAREKMRNILLDGRYMDAM